MKWSSRKSITRIMFPVVIANILVFGVLLLLDVFESLTASAQSPYPGPTQTSPIDPYPGGTVLPTQTRSPSTTITPTSNPYPIITSTQVYSGTPTFLPMPTIDLLFPGVLPKTPTTALSTAAIEISSDLAKSEQPSPPVSLFLALIVVLWGLLGVFLVIYIRRLGYH